MKKILFIHHAGNFSGAARSLGYLVQHLDKKQFDPEILIIQKGTATDFFKQLNFKVTVNNTLYPFDGTTVSGMSFKRFVKNWLGFVLTYLRFSGQIKKINPDIIHLNTTCLWVFAMVAKRFNRSIKIVSHIREPLLDSLHGVILRYFNERYVDELIAISNYDASRFRAREKVTVVYNFVDTAVFSPEINKNSEFREKYKIDHKSVVFLYLSRVAPTNGALEFVKIAREIANTHPSFVFIVAGFHFQSASDYNQKVKVIADSSENIILLEMVLDVVTLISECDVIASPFTIPHFSRSVIEGAAMGKPAIVSNVGSQNELIVAGETGILYDHDDQYAFKSAIITLGTNRKLIESMGKKARLNALENFSLKTNSEKTYSIYRKLLITNV